MDNNIPNRNYTVEEFISWSEACADFTQRMFWKFALFMKIPVDDSNDFADIFSWLFANLAVASKVLEHFSSRICAIDDRPATEMYCIAIYAKDQKDLEPDDVKWVAYSEANAHLVMIRFLQKVYKIVFQEYPPDDLHDIARGESMLSWSSEERAKEKSQKEAEIKADISVYSSRLGKHRIHYSNVADLVNACFRERCKLVYRLDPAAFLKDGGKLKSQGSFLVEPPGPIYVTSTQIVKALGTTRLTREHKKDWPEPVIKAVGGKPDTWRLEDLRPHLAKTFSYHKVIDWNNWLPAPEE